MSLSTTILVSITAVQRYVTLCTMHLETAHLLLSLCLYIRSRSHLTLKTKQEAQQSQLPVSQRKQRYSREREDMAVEL